MKKLLIFLIVIILFSCSSQSVIDGTYLASIDAVYKDFNLSFNEDVIDSSINKFSYSELNDLNISFSFSHIKRHSDKRILQVQFLTQNDIMISEKTIEFSKDKKDDFSFDFSIDNSDGKVPPGIYKINLMNGKELVDFYHFEILNDKNFKYFPQLKAFIKELDYFYFHKNGRKYPFLKNQKILRDSIDKIGCDVELLSIYQNQERRIPLTLESQHKNLQSKKLHEEKIVFKKLKTVLTKEFILESDSKWNPGEYALTLKYLNDKLSNTSLEIEAPGTKYDAGLNRFVTSIKTFSSNSKQIKEEYFTKYDKLCSFNEKYLYWYFEIYNEKIQSKVVSELEIKFFNERNKLVDVEHISLELPKNEKFLRIYDFFLLRKTMENPGTYRIEIYRDDLLILTKDVDISSKSERLYYDHQHFFIDRFKMKNKIDLLYPNSFEKNAVLLDLFLTDRKRYRDFDVTFVIIDSNRKSIASGSKHFILEHKEQEVQLEIPLKFYRNKLISKTYEIKLYINGQYLQSRITKIKNN